MISEFDETTFRTPQINSALSSILLINNQLRSKKKGKITPKSDFSRQVTPEGFEPPTVGAEIQYSIQLNYGASFLLMIIDDINDTEIIHQQCLESNFHTANNLCTQNFVTQVILVLGVQKIISECENTEIFVNFILCGKI